MEFRGETVAIFSEGDFARWNIREEEPSRDALAALTKKQAMVFSAIPISLEDHVLKIAVSDPYDYSSLDEMRSQISHVDLCLFVGTRAGIITAIQSYYPSG